MKNHKFNKFFDHALIGVTAVSTSLVLVIGLSACTNSNSESGADTAMSGTTDTATETTGSEETPVETLQIALEGDDYVSVMVNGVPSDGEEVTVSIVDSDGTMLATKTSSQSISLWVDNIEGATGEYQIEGTDLTGFTVDVMATDSTSCSIEVDGVVVEAAESLSANLASCSYNVTVE